MGFSGSYRSTSDVEYGKMGPCLVPGHKKEHPLDVSCLAAMRNYFYDDGNFGKSFSQYLKAVEKKG